VTTISQIKSIYCFKNLIEFLKFDTNRIHSAIKKCKRVQRTLYVTLQRALYLNFDILLIAMWIMYLYVGCFYIKTKLEWNFLTIMYMTFQSAFDAIVYGSATIFQWVNEFNVVSQRFIDMYMYTIVDVISVVTVPDSCQF